jgi:hypothetical protein
MRKYSEINMVANTFFPDKYRTNNKVMINFPAGVVKAEQLTGGNANILNTLETPTKIAKSSTTVGTPTPESNKKTAPPSPTTPTTNKKPAGSYNSSVKVQNTNNSERHKSNENRRLTCTMCDFATDRMNLLMMHIKNHSISIMSGVKCKLYYNVNLFFN